MIQLEGYIMTTTGKCRIPIKMPSTIRIFIVLALAIACLSWAPVYGQEKKEYYTTDEATGLCICRNPDTEAYFDNKGSSTPQAMSPLYWFMKTTGYMKYTFEDLPLGYWFSFIVLEDGTITDLKINVKSESISGKPTNSFEAEFLETVNRHEELHKWVPAKINGRPVNTRVEFPIVI